MLESVCEETTATMFRHLWTWIGAKRWILDLADFKHPHGRAVTYNAVPPSVLYVCIVHLIHCSSMLTKSLKASQEISGTPLRRFERLSLALDEADHQDSVLKYTP